MIPTLTQIAMAIITGSVFLVITNVIIINKTNESMKDTLRDVTKKIDSNNEKTIEANYYLKDIRDCLKENQKLLQEMLRKN